ncbi:MAG TPA: YsnF/AvaK domain-containing protein [Bryobacteraceae bacterium]|nr:YsnF/AvaK domain-containing protein [Bryobacteraceae bacterium]
MVTNTIVAIFPDAQTADAVVGQLADAGIPKSRIHVGSSADFASDAASGGAALSGNAPRHHTGGFIGWLESLFGHDESNEDRRHYSDAVRRGQCVVAVDADGAERDRAIDIMENNGALNVDEGRDTSRAGLSSEPRATGQTIPVVREELQVGKREIRRGGVRVYTRTVEQPVEQQVTLREEKVNVERRPVDRPASNAADVQLRDQVIEVLETAEEPIVRKQARVVEEVVVGKETTQRTETVRDTVRNQRIEVERIPGAEGEDVASQSDVWRRDYDTRYAASGEPYENYRPAYEYGYRSASDPRWRGRSFDDAEQDLRTDYLRNNPTSAWDRVRGAVRYGWERMTGKR